MSRKEPELLLQAQARSLCTRMFDPARACLIQAKMLHQQAKHKHCQLRC